MSFKKITISLPESLYEEGMSLVKKGLFSNFSDLVRSGIRGEFKELNNVIKDFEDRFVYGDKELVEGVKNSKNEFKSGKGITLKSNKEMKNYLERL